jgi:hypothetical protein
MIVVTLASRRATRPARIQAVVAAVTLLSGASALVEGAAAAPAALAAFTSAGLIGAALSMVQHDRSGQTPRETDPIHAR